MHCREPHIVRHPVATLVTDPAREPLAEARLDRAGATLPDFRRSSRREAGSMRLWESGRGKVGDHAGSLRRPAPGNASVEGGVTTT
jgi:hypothetical protein